MKPLEDLFREILVSNFCGGGGDSQGAKQATGREVDVAINHSIAAIRMHKANHPGTEHYLESVWDINPLTVTGGRPVGLCWFSPDCKHFSKAKGGKPVEKNIRGLAWVAVRWAAVVKPRVIMLENVEEFKTWGPLLKNGMPDPDKKGHTFKAFVNALKRHGYHVDWKELRACDFGSPTIRKRFFLVARRDNMPISWPKPTHGDPKSEAVISGKLKPWRTAAECIDWSLPCPSIFERKKPLAENTMKRIARGIQKFVIENPEPFVIKVNHHGLDFRGQRIDEPLQTVTAKNGWGIVTPYIARIGQTGFGADRMQYSIEEPLTTIVTKAEHLLITPTLMVNTTGHPGSGVDTPTRTITTGNQQFLVTPTLIQYHGEQSDKETRGQSLGRPLMVVDASPRYALVASFLAKHYGGNYTGPGSGMDKPIPTVTTVDHNALVTSHLVKMKGTNIGQKVTEPIQTITAGGLHFGEVRAFLMKYYGTGEGQAVDEPMHTVTTKDKFGLVTIHGENYQIVDIGMRMLEPRELFNAQGFPEDYIIDRDCDGKKYSKADQVARCGNAVPPQFSEALIRANLPELCVPQEKVTKRYARG
ncbi:DNA (cytosine-5)-methyltransferase 1 [Anaerospora hongkongensis]|uniref:DNA (cytosine-5-)-methyltransferase n=1 Tax=Anaerospora hongkongensis TaxID=244830 RepID=A0A4R1Q2G0_9FIRM|nr:DNA cytosine methyltransferase [Anaerospora hongkongensis]TCL40007.1 DNA (cytosine-5)-methyltransferase 1 [Anaerospora hongkongensis]